MKLRITYDIAADASYIYLKDEIEFGEVAETRYCEYSGRGGPILLQFDSNGKLIGIEVLSAREVLPAELLKALTNSGIK